MNTFLQIQGGGGLVHQLRKSYSLTDLGNDESDFGGAELRAITNDTGKNSLSFHVAVFNNFIFQIYFCR